MRHINWIRVFVGGIVAGLIIDVVQWVSMACSSGLTGAALQALGRPIHESAGSMIFYILLGFAYGIMATWTYAAIRPRLERVPQRSRCWTRRMVAGILSPAGDVDAHGRFPAYLLATVMVIGLVEILIATEAGARVYREEDPRIRTAAQALKRAA